MMKPQYCDHCHMPVVWMDGEWFDADTQTSGCPDRDYQVPGCHEVDPEPEPEPRWYRLREGRKGLYGAWAYGPSDLAWAILCFDPGPSAWVAVWTADRSTDLPVADSLPVPMIGACLSAWSHALASWDSRSSQGKPARVPESIGEWVDIELA